MAILSIIKIFELGDIFFFFLGIYVTTGCKRVLVLFLSLTILKTSLMILVLFLLSEECLIGRRYMISIGYINREMLANLFFSKSLCLFFTNLYP